MPSGIGLIHEEHGKIVELNEIPKPDELVEIYAEDWNLEGIMTVEDVEDSELRGKICALQEKFCFASDEALAEVLANVAPAKQFSRLERQVTKWELTLADAKWKLQVPKSVVL